MLAPDPRPALRHCTLSGLLLAGVLAAAALGAGSAGPPPCPVPIGGAPRDLPGLPNVVRLSERLYSGGAPEGDAGFETLRKLGIRTLLSVDGMPPDVAAARRCGMRYVHIPFGYDGCPRPTANRIVRAVRDLPGPLYLHCHHGKHRSPTGAAFARIALDGVSNEEAVREMERAGTGRSYAGLFAAVRAYLPPAPEELERVPAGFPEAVPPPPLVEAMVRIDTRCERLLRLWKESSEGPAVREALQLRELFAELSRTREVREKPPEFRKRMAEAGRDAKSLQAALGAGDRRRAGRLLGRLAVGCRACHAKYRDAPARP